MIGIEEEQVDFGFYKERSMGLVVLRADTLMQPVALCSGTHWYV